MKIHFTKMHGLGNDFMVIDAIRQSIHLSAQQIKKLAQRHTGIGFDQCLLVEKSQQKDIDFFYRIFNADGQEVGQCGNGARCLARFLQYYQLTSKRLITVATKTTRMQLQLNEDDTVTINMGEPKLQPIDIPLHIDEQANLYTLPLQDNKTCQVHALSLGNPHAVMVTADLNAIDVHQLGRDISKHPLFPEQCNAGFMQILNTQHVRLRVYERGCGETLACGSGAVAAAAAGQLYHHLAEKVCVSLPGGDLFIHWPQYEGDIYLTGPATFVYEGTFL